MIVHRSKIPILGVTLVALILAAALPGGAGAAADHFTPLTATVLDPPEPVRGGDGREHLVYELVIDNVSAFPPHPVTLDRVKVVAEAPAMPMGSLYQLALRERMSQFSGVTPDKSPTTIAPGGSAKLLMDVTYPAGQKPPTRLDHELVVSPGPKDSVELSHFRTAPTPVIDRPAAIIAPPLRGPGWVVVNGCCDEATSHRNSLLSINGTLHEGERYAIDFVQMTPAGRIADGPSDELASYPFYDDEVLSATAGRVVSVADRLPDGPIDFELPPRKAGDAGGNHVSVDMGDGRYAYYAHLVPGSVRVKVGERVQVGETLGLLGNSGNSNAPHLHFQLMDGPSPLGSEGVPYRFSSFTDEGTLTNLGPFFALGAKAKLATTPRGRRHAELPLNLQVLDFGP